MPQQHQPSPTSRHAALLTTLTIDMSHALRTLNSNTWKNNSGKLMNRTIVEKVKLTGREEKENANFAMTEDDIDKLFQRQKTDHKQREYGKQILGGRKERMMTYDQNARDFVSSVKFLKSDDETDRLLGGLPTLPSVLTENRISLLFDPSPSDLTAEFKKDYMVGKIVGEGAYASVRVAIHKPTNKKVAIKVYQKSKIKDAQRKKSVRRQIRILQMLHHPNIVAIHDVVQTNNHLNIIMEYLSGISLGTYIKSQANHRANQKNAKIILKGIVQGLAYLHGMMIAHRDVKLENIILAQDLTPKLIDFGFSTCIEKNKKVKIFCGTPSYMAPEIVQKKEYRGESADIWALGVLFFVTITGIFPFKGSTDQELYKKINSADYPKSELFFSKDIGDLIGRMLKIAPQERITAKQMLSHPWFKSAETSEVKKKHQKKNTQASECRKRTTTSSHKSKQKQKILNQTGNIRKLTETCKDANLKLELRNIRQSPLKLNSTFTHRKLNKELQKATLPQNKLQSGLIGNFKKELRQNNKIPAKQNKERDFMKQLQFYKQKQGKDKDRQILNKTNSKVVQLLKMGLKRKQQDKSKGKIKRS